MAPGMVVHCIMKGKRKCLNVFIYDLPGNPCADPNVKVPFVQESARGLSRYSVTAGEPAIHQMRS